MATVAELRVPVSAAGLKLRVKVNLSRTFRVRAWLGVLLLKLAGWVIGLDMELELNGPRDPAPAPSLAIPPVRQSVHALDRADAPVTYEDARRIKVTLDGMVVKNVVAYDCEEGWLERHLRNRAGEHVIRNDHLVLERVRGTVTAEYRSEA